MWKVWPYSGKPLEIELSPPATHFDSIPAMVKHMVQELAGTGRNVTMDRYFTSIPLAEELLSERLTVVGKINKRRKFLPKEITDPRNRQVGSSLFAFRNDVTLVSHCPKASKLVTAISTQHRNTLVDRRTEKPELVLYYNATKGGVDVMDSIIESYVYKPALTRWPTAVFLFMMGTAQVNASTIPLINRGEEASQVRKGARRAIMYAMGEQLLRPRILERQAHPVGLNAATLAALGCVKRTSGEGSGGGTSGDGASGGGSSTAARGRCVICLHKVSGTGQGSHRSLKEKMAKKPSCSLCHKYVCEKHSVDIRKCENCSLSI